MNEWIKSIINHLWWAISTCDGDETLLREKWCSILFHIQNKYRSSSCSKFHKCVHPRITKGKTHKKLWVNPTSDACKALQSIVLDKHVLIDLKYLTKFSHTGILDIFYALHNGSALLSFRNGHKKPISHNGFQLWQRSAKSKSKGRSRKIQLLVIRK